MVSLVVTSMLSLISGALLLGRAALLEESLEPVRRELHEREAEALEARLKEEHGRT